ncbi:Disintegrin and metalloproteinase domain-containing protein 23 [Varanus komodoensis]|nr:Disintegrin and metalloproteinase domain-containing protein 23 [Varanus komodoensis]
MGDTLMVLWSNINFYAFPPIPLITKVIAKIIHDNATESNSFASLSASVENILQFLFELHRSELKPSYIKVYTAAISHYRGVIQVGEGTEWQQTWEEAGLIYKEQLNTRVVLVAVETWSDRDRINVRPDPRQMLHDFSKYRQHFIRQHADAVHLLSNVTFHYKRSSLSYFGGICSVARGVGVNEYGLPWAMAQELSQSLAQNLGIQWEPASRKPKGCDCTESWGGCIMEETGIFGNLGQILQ